MSIKKYFFNNCEIIKRNLIKILFIFLFLIFLNENLEASNFIRISDSTTLYYEDQGIGQPVIFIPGWTATHKFFSKQVDYFKKKYT